MGPGSGAADPVTRAGPRRLAVMRAVRRVRARAYRPAQGGIFRRGDRHPLDGSAPAPAQYRLYHRIHSCQAPNAYPPIMHGRLCAVTITPPHEIQMLHNRDCKVTMKQ